MNTDSSRPAAPRKRRIPRSFKELTPANHFNPRTFFYEMVWKGWLTKRSGAHRTPAFPTLVDGQLALTWIGHASFLAQWSDLNVLIDPNFANWLFLLKRLKHAGLKVEHLPQIDLVLISHAHYDHFHKPSIRKLPGHSRIAVVPQGMGELAENLGFERVIELQWWESFHYKNWRITMTPTKHWGSKHIRDVHRECGGFVLEHQGRKLYHAGDSAYSDTYFKEIGKRLAPEIALLPIGAYFPDTFRRVHMGPDEALKVFQETKAKWMVPMHYGTFKLSFEDIEEPPRWLKQLAHKEGVLDRIRILEEGVPEVF
jgi:L-ascorbate metabolism protein UlaG (beta-lactamase superfamily)